MPVSTNHPQNWFDSILSRKPPICDVAIGHRSASVCHLGNIAIRTGRKITWDPVKEQIVGDTEAAKMLFRALPGIGPETLFIPGRAACGNDRKMDCIRLNETASR